MAVNLNPLAIAISSWVAGGDGKVRGADPTGALGGGDFQLSASNYVVSDLTMEIAAPRPDVERSANSRYDFASTEFEYEVPITVKGGSYPFKYEITARSGTANVATATIGETRTYGVGREWLGSANQKDYGVLRWTPSCSCRTRHRGSP